MAINLLSALTTLAPEDRATYLAKRHRDYTAWKSTWQMLIDAYDGSGGFANGGYLWQFSRELPDKFKERQAQARYHNYVETLVDLYARYLFAQPPARNTTSEALRLWWENVDGAGAGINSFMEATLSQSLACAHSGILMDRPALVPSGPTRADERKATPYLVRYQPLDIADWLVQRDGTLDGLKLIEAAPLRDPLKDTQGDKRVQYLVWDADGWMRFKLDGETVVGGIGATRLGRVPFVLLRPKKSEQFDWIGKPLVASTVIRALYNRASEEDDVLRNQAFSIFVVKNIPADVDVEEVKRALGGDVGTTSALFVKGEATYVTPDQDVARGLREHQQYLVRELYRMGHLRYDQDSKETQTAEAIRLQNAELNQMLTGLATELTRVEQELARLYFAWTSPDAVAAQRAYDAAEVTIAYPREFFVSDLATELTAWAQALAFELGDTFDKHLRKQVVKRVAPHLDSDTAKQVEQEIDASQREPPQAGGALEADALRANAASRLSQFMAQGEPQQGEPA